MVLMVAAQRDKMYRLARIILQGRCKAENVYTICGAATRAARSVGDVS